MRTGAGAGASTTCAGQRLSCQALVDRHLHDPDRALALTEVLQAACKRGDRDACWALAWFLADGANVPTHPTRARELFTRSCEAGHAPSCRGLGWMLLEGLGGARDPVAAQARFRAACDAGDPRACVAYARSFTALGRTLLPADAIDRLEAACRADELAACAELAAVLTVQPGGDRAEQRAFELAGRACDGGSARGCGVLGRSTARGIGTSADAGAAQPLLVRACEGGDVVGCLDVIALKRGATLARARLVELCDGGELDACTGLSRLLVVEGDVAALPLAKRACARHRAEGCFNVAVALADGLGKAPEPFAAIPFNRRACDLGMPRGCFWLARAHYAGENVPRSDAAGDQVLDEACARGLADSCRDLALVREQDGHPGTVAAFERACTAGSGASCVQAATMLRAEKDPARALPLDQRACALGEAESCTYAARAAFVGAPGDEAAGAAMARRACRLESLEGCTLLAWVLVWGRGVPADPARGLALGEQTCKRNSAEGCSIVGFAELVARRAPAALARLSRACELGHAASCTMVAWLYAMGHGVEHDEGTALLMFRHACAGGDGPACHQVWHMLRDGIGAAADPERARQAFQRACELHGQCVRVEPEHAADRSPPRARGPFREQRGTCVAATWSDVPAGRTTLRWSFVTWLDLAEASLTAFSMRTTEVTQCQYLACVKAKRCTAPDAARMQPSDAAMVPVTGVTHAQAETYCAWEGGRLPSEAEWVHAAQGSGEPKFVWGDEEPACVRERKACAAEMPLAGATSFDVSAFGVRDLAGTVGEWTGDWFGRWPLAPGLDPMGPPEGVAKVVRGGGITMPVLALWSRGRLPPDRASAEVGFRCVKRVGR